RAARLGRVRVQPETERWIVWDEAAHFEPRIVAKIRGCDVSLPTGQQRGTVDAGKGLVRLLDDPRARGAGAADAGRLAGRDIGKAAWLEHSRADTDASLDDIDKPLIATGREHAATLEFGGVLHECRTTGRRGVDDRGRVPHAGEWRANKRLGRLQPVVVIVSASTWQIHGRKN